jgi:hypothetical protein
MNREQILKELEDLEAEAYEMWVHAQQNRFLSKVGKVCEDAYNFINGEIQDE